MKRVFLVCCVLALLAGLLCCPLPAAASGHEPEAENYLNIATIDSRPLSIDRLLYVALKEAGYKASFAPMLLQTGYGAANDGDKDGVIASTPDIEQTYPNLIKVPVPLEQTYLYAFIRADSGLEINDWRDLSGLKVGINSQRPYIISQIPSSSEIVEFDTVAQVMEGLSLGEYDAAILSHHAHETLHIPSGVKQDGKLDTLTEYLYLNKSYESLVPGVAEALNNIFADGRGEKILDNIPTPETGQKKTVLHIVSSDMYVSREDRFNSKLRARFENDTSIDWYTVDLNTRHFSGVPNRLVYFADLLRQDCLSKDVAAIIVSGDDALEFLLGYYNLLFRNTPVLFYGVRDEYKTAIHGYEEYFTGVVESLSAYETVETAITLFPDTKNLYVVNGYTTEGSHYRSIIEKQLEPFADSINIEYNENMDIDALVEHIKGLPQDGMVLVGSYFCDASGQYYPLYETKRLLEKNCSVPIFTIYSTDLEYNAIGGKCLDYESYGETIAYMLKRLLAGEDTDNISIVADSSDYNKWVFNKTIMDKMGVAEKSLPDGARILNKIPSIWESDPRFAYTLVALFVMSVIVVVGMSIFIFRHRRQKILISTRQSLQTVLDLLPVPVRILDIEEKKIIYANKAVGELFKVEDIEKAYGRPGSSFMPPTQPDGTASSEMSHIFSEGRLASSEVVCLKTDGEMFDCLVTSCIIDYNGKKASLGIIEDLTSAKEHRRMLESTAEKEKEANQLKSRFLVNMSHEIRTPMNAIIGLTEIELRKKPAGEAKEIYKKINVSAKNLLGIINDILDLSKIEADKMELFNDEFELEEAVSSALLVASPRLDEKNVEFLLNGSLDLPRFVIGDRTRLWQILKNFLDNAAKYTDEGKIVVSVFENCKLSDGEKIYITFIVEDTGIGIDEEQMQRLFLPYEQIHNNAQKKYTGTGLGMAISKQLCELMGGNVRIDSKPGVGTTVFITIPFRRSQNKDTGMHAVRVPALNGVNVLAVDDDAISLSIMERLLKGSNASCTLARSGEAAMETIFRCREKGESFDLILLDYMMDGLNGIETARQIQTGLSKSPKLLMVTAYQRLLLKQELEENGIDDIIEKPFIPTQFMHKICAVLGYEDAESDADGQEEFIKFKDVHVLICEDYRLNQEVAVGMFAQFGMTSTVAEDGKQGLDILNSGKRFDLIFMDLQMPVMDGYEATKAIRSDSRFDHIPIISLTADAMKEIVDKCMEIGMNDHIAKPMEFRNVYKVLLKWLPESKRVPEGEVVQFASGTADGILPRFGGDQALHLNALSEFADLLPGQWPGFDCAVQDADETSRFVHKLKGAAGNLSEQEIYQYAIEFESSMRKGSPDKDAYDRLVGASGAFKKRMSQQVSGVDDASVKAGTPEELEENLAVLKDTLENYDLKKSSKVYEALKEKSWPSADQEKLDRLCDLLKSYDYEAALDVLEQLQEASGAGLL